MTEDLRALERELARDALASAETKRLMTIPGIDMVVAFGLLAAIGPIDRLNSSGCLVAFLAPPPRMLVNRITTPRDQTFSVDHGDEGNKLSLEV